MLAPLSPSSTGAPRAVPGEEGQAGTLRSPRVLPNPHFPRGGPGGRAGFINVPPALVLMLCCCHREILKNFLTRQELCVFISHNLLAGPTGGLLLPERPLSRDQSKGALSSDLFVSSQL